MRVGPVGLLGLGACSVGFQVERSRLRFSASVLGLWCLVSRFLACRFLGSWLLDGWILVACLWLSCSLVSSWFAAWFLRPWLVAWFSWFAALVLSVVSSSCFVVFSQFAVQFTSSVHVVLLLLPCSLRSFTLHHMVFFFIFTGILHHLH